VTDVMITDRYRRSEASHPPPGVGSRDRGPEGEQPPALWPLFVTVVLVAAANYLAVSGMRLPFLGPVLGFWFLVVHPAYLLYTTSLWGRTSVAERVGYSLTATLLLLLTSGLAINFALPLVGVHKPLDTMPVVVLGDVLTVGLLLLRRRFPAKLSWRGRIGSLRWQESRLLVGGTASVALAVLGANRLNNGAGDLVSLICLGSAVVTLSLLVRWHRSVRDGLASATLYLVSLALLLMTALRGWSVTGHDIQLEYRVFQLTEANGHWSIASLRDAYNACLSITILPTELAHVLNIDNVYVYKVFFQLIFAVCPTLVFALSRRHWSKPVSILAAIYFAGFPTFFTDMPYLNRQEIAFLFVAAGILAITNFWWEQRRRLLVLLGAGVGIELSHYSTMYLFVGILLITWLIDRTLPAARRLGRKGLRAPTGHARAPSWGLSVRNVGLASIGILASLIFVWGGLATHTANSALGTAGSAVTGFFKHSGAVAPYSLFSRAESNSPILMHYYRIDTLQENQRADANSLACQTSRSDCPYVPISSLAQIPTPIVNQPSLPLTATGRFLSKVGVPVRTLDSTVRQGAAKDEQLFVIVGLIVLVTVRRYQRQLSRELVALSIASVVIVGLFTLFPDLSVDYGALRAFQESLLVVAPMLVVGSLTVFSLFGQIWSMRLAAATCLLVFASTTGLMPQIFGGYQAQLSLNNSGQYYDIYYQHPQEAAAVSWLGGQQTVLPNHLDAPLGTTTANRFSFTALSDVTGSQHVGDIFPTLISRSSWVVLGYTTVHTGRAALYIDGQLIYYDYPVAFLRNNKNIVYNNGGTQIYR
jgi:uncharacterized membrane protein